MEKPSTTEASEIKVELRNWLKNAKRVVVAGVGSSIRKDDFIGVETVRKLQKKASQSVYLIECETVPESFIEPIIEFRPTHILVIDAALLNLKPGVSRLIKPDQLAKLPATSTHALPLQIFCQYLEETTRAKIALLVIQPKDTSLGEGLTAELEKTAEHLTELLLESLP